MMNRLPPRLRQFVVYLQFQWSHIFSLGLLGVVRRLIRKALTVLLSMILLPISLVLYVAGFRRFCMFTDRIGHLAIEPDTLLKAQKLGIIQPRRWFVLAPKHRVANQHLMRYWEQYFIVFRSTFTCFIVNAISLWPFLRYDASRFINNSKGTQLTYDINKQWGNKPPILKLSEVDQQFAEQQLALLGLPQNAWFVCVHVREGGFSPVDEVLHCHRNGKIENVLPAITEITRRGGWVVRMGDPTMVPLKPMPQVIDYAHHPLRSDRLDILLCAKARFILGNTSGLFLVSSVFGVPSALANMIPMPTLGCCYDDLSIPKLLRRATTKEYLSFNEIMNSPVSTFRYASLYQQHQIIVEENTAEDILALTKEMLDRLAGEFIESEEDKRLHDQYMALMTPKHYSYGAISKISVNFLKRYQYLLERIDH